VPAFDDVVVAVAWRETARIQTFWLSTVSGSGQRGGMTQRLSFFENLTDEGIARIRGSAVQHRFQKDERIFSEGEPGDAFYVIESGSVSVFFEKDGEKKQLRLLKAGDYFGEMSIINRDKRSASVEATEDSRLLRINRDRFLALTDRYPVLADKITPILTQRNEELILRESLSDAVGIRSKHLYVSIKGDPSLRETALFRERYESPVDTVLEQLVPNLEDLLLSRCAYQLTVNFNSGEIRVRSVFKPFSESIHTAARLSDKAYIERHFTEVPYAEKLTLIKSTSEFISAQPQSRQLSAQWKNIFARSLAKWQPISAAEISSIMSRLADLRRIPNFYLRNFSISMVQDAIRMQFNCDGTHIVSSDDYLGFIKNNFDA